MADVNSYEGGGRWAGPEEALGHYITEESKKTLESYRVQPHRVDEDARTEQDAAQGGYQRRQLFKVVQNSADALSPVTDNADALSPVTDNADALSPVTDSADALSPVTDGADALSPDVSSVGPLSTGDGEATSQGESDPAGSDALAVQGGGTSRCASPKTTSTAPTTERRSTRMG